MIALLAFRRRFHEASPDEPGAALDRASLVLADTGQARHRLVERREAPPPHQRGRRPHQPPVEPIARLRQRRSRKPPGASRRSVPSPRRGKEKGKDAPASQRIGPAERWLAMITVSDGQPRLDYRRAG